MGNLEKLFVYTSFGYMALLLIHFALRRWAFDAYIIQYGWFFYLFSLPAAVVRLILRQGGMAWYFWLPGFLYLVWAVFGYIVEYRLGIAWREPIVWWVFGPFVTLYRQRPCSTGGACRGSAARFGMCMWRCL